MHENKQPDALKDSDNFLMRPISRKLAIDLDILSISLLSINIYLYPALGLLMCQSGVYRHPTVGLPHTTVGLPYPAVGLVTESSVLISVTHCFSSIICIKE